MAGVGWAIGGSGREAFGTAVAVNRSGVCGWAERAGITPTMARLLERRNRSERRTRGPWNRRRPPAPPCGRGHAPVFLDSLPLCRARMSAVTVSIWGLADRPKEKK